jgi:hypothetical protein
MTYMMDPVEDLEEEKNLIRQQKTKPYILEDTMWVTCFPLCHGLIQTPGKDWDYQ